MRQGYVKYSDGLWRRIFPQRQGAHCFMQVRGEDGRLVQTVNGRKSISAALVEVQILKTSGEQKEMFDALRAVGLAQLSGGDSDA